MTVTLEPHPGVAAVHDLAPEIARRAPEIEAARRVPSDLLDSLRAAGCFRVLRPVAGLDEEGRRGRAGGGTSLYEDSPLQRRLRDVEAVSQHFLIKPDTLTTCGAVLAGESPDLTIF